MFVQIITCGRRQGIAAASRKPYSFQVIGGLLNTAQGVEFVEFNIADDHPTPEPGKRYELDLSFYPDREKKLSFRVEGLRALPAQAAKAA